MFKKNRKNYKSQAQATQAEYENIVKQINKYSYCVIQLYVEYYKKYYIVAKIIALAYDIKLILKFLKSGKKLSEFKSFFRERDNNFAHNAVIYKFGQDPRIVESTSKHGGVNHMDLYDYFRPHFKGKVVAKIIPTKMSKYEHQKFVKYIEHELIGCPYNVKAALNAWYDLSEDQKIEKGTFFCTQLMWHLTEWKHGDIIDHNAEYTPGQSFNLSILNDLCAIDLIVRDTKNDRC